MSTRFDDSLPRLSLAELTLNVEAAAAEMAITSPEYLEVMKHYAERGAEIAQSIAPVGDRTHQYNGIVDEPGDYRDSIKGIAVLEDGVPVGIVHSTDFKAWWIEFGTVHQAPMAVLRRARAQLTEEIGGEFDDADDVQSNWSGWRNEYQSATPVD